MLIIRDITMGNPVTIAPHVSLRDAVKVLARYGLSGMPVVDGRSVIGTLSAGDVADFQSTHPGTPGCDPLADHVVADAMSAVRPSTLLTFTR